MNAATLRMNDKALYSGLFRNNPHHLFSPSPIYLKSWPADRFELEQLNPLYRIGGEKNVSI